MKARTRTDFEMGRDAELEKRPGRVREITRETLFGILVRAQAEKRNWEIIAKGEGSSGIHAIRAGRHTFEEHTLGDYSEAKLLIDLRCIEMGLARIGIRVRADAVADNRGRLPKHGPTITGSNPVRRTKSKKRRK